MKRYLSPRLGLEQVFDLLLVDTEFTRLPYPKEGIWNWASQCRVLAVGIVPLHADAGVADGFYAKRKIAKQVLSQCSPFVIESVIPHLDDAEASMVFEKEIELAGALASYLETRQQKSGKAPLLAVDWLGDAYLLSPLLPSDPSWMLVEGIAEIERALGDGWPPGRSRHNALHDAMGIRDGYRAYLQERCKP